ncbi:MAG: YvcK family protein [Dehalococcoidales bacterium]|nr:YvcK family protein [Dehalococcoidales bacterium]
MDSLKWLYPGMGVKRWLLLLLLGITVIGLGIAYVMTHLYREQPFPGWVGILTLQFIPRLARAALFIGVGGGIIVFAFAQLGRSLLSAYLPVGREDKIIDIVYQKRLLSRGPKIVCIGGGTGLSTLLRGIKEYTSNLTAIVTVADNGGSSGRLRRDFGLPPPGDFRQCIAALADAEPLMTRLFQYRFNGGSGLDGHSFGNLFIVAMSDITGNFERAIRESSRVLAVRGQILPSTLANVHLAAEMEDAEVVEGESEIAHALRRIKRVFLQPDHPAAYPEALRAILQADLIIAGPGSLYTSVLPNLLVDDVARAVRASSATKVYACNVATQPGETDNFHVTDHLDVLESHIGHQLFDYVLVNNNHGSPISPKARAVPVELNGDLSKVQETGVKLVLADLVDPDNGLHHDPKKLASSIMRIYYDRSQTSAHKSGQSKHKVGA